jgi:hypothetical protein
MSVKKEVEQMTKRAGKVLNTVFTLLTYSLGTPS